MAHRVEIVWMSSNVAWKCLDVSFEPIPPSDVGVGPRFIVRQRYGLKMRGLHDEIFAGGVGHPELDALTICDFPTVVNQRFPATVLSACAGKPILEVIDHPVTRERYSASDVIERAFWDDGAQVSVFEVRRAA